MCLPFLLALAGGGAGGSASKGMTLAGCREIHGSM